MNGYQDCPWPFYIMLAEKRQRKTRKRRCNEGKGEVAGLTKRERRTGEKSRKFGKEDERKKKERK